MSETARISLWTLLAMGMGTAALLAQAPPPPAPAAATPPATAPAGTPAGGQIQFATPVYDFGKVKSGDPVKYTYVFTNTGCGTLEVTHVQPQCGCTTAGEWTRKVDPGQTGLVPIQFNSGNYPSGPVTKMITVMSSDSNHPQTVLQLKGVIWKPIEFQPTMAVLNIGPDGPGAPTIVKILNNMEEPVTLSPPESNNRMATATLVTNQPGKEYQLAISAEPGLKTPFNAAITIKTSSTNMPVLTIPFWVNVQPAVTIVPSVVLLPGGPLGDKAMPTVRIESRSTNQMKLSEPKVTVEGVEVQLKELQADRIWEAQFAFPPGFQLAQGQRAKFTAKSSLPQYPLIEVPINQTPSGPNAMAPVSRPLPPGVPGGRPLPPRVPPPAVPVLPTPPPRPPQSAAR
jgi:hypothetical protein